MKYPEIIELHKKLMEKNIPHDFRNWFDGYQILCPSEEAWRRPDTNAVSIIQTCFSYGGTEGLLETKGLYRFEEDDDNGVVGRLTVDEVYNAVLEYCCDFIK